MNRTDQMRKMRGEIDPITNKYFTIAAIGKKFGVTRQRVAQLIGNTGRPSSSRIDKEYTCNFCNSIFTFSILVLGNYRPSKKFCSVECSSRARAEVVPGKLKNEFTKEDWKIWDKHHNSYPSSVRSRRNYTLANKEKIYAYNRNRYHTVYKFRRNKLSTQ